jgi:hypothetical protein
MRVAFVAFRVLELLIKLLLLLIVIPFAKVLLLGKAPETIIAGGLII